jgi:low temperature requirement protein LtrA
MERQKRAAMTTGRAEGLLRTHEQARAAFLELFFDLVFVLAFFRLSQQLLEHLSWPGALQTLVLLLAVLMVWFFAALYTDTFNLQHPGVQLVIILIMFSALVMAAATPTAFGRHGLAFAGAYVTVRVGANAAAVLLLRGHEGQRNALRILFWAGMSVVPWLAGAFVHGSAREPLWIAAAAVDFAGVGLGFPTPKLGRAGAQRVEIVISEEHVAERYQQFFIIALGEPILVTGLTFANGEFGAGRTAATIVAFATTALLWRIYIHRAGALLADAIAAAANIRRVAVLTIYSHVIMVAGIITIAVADELVIQHPSGRPHPAWIAVIIGGPALFLVGRDTFEYTVFGRPSRPRVIGTLALLAITPAMTLVPPLAVAAAAAIVLACVVAFILTGVAVSDAVRTRRLPSERPQPPR